MGLFGPPDVGKMKARKNIKGLIKTLESQKNEEICKSAANALREIGFPAVEELIESLSHNNPSVREAICSILGDIGDERAIKPLIELLKDNESYWSEGERKAATRALGNIGGDKVVKPLIGILKDKDSDTRQAAVEALSKVGKRAEKPLINAFNNELWGLEEAIEAVSFGPSWTHNHDIKSQELRLNMKNDIVHALGRIGSQKAIETLILINDKDFYKVSTEALVKIGEPAVKFLIKALRHDDSTIQKKAADVLEKIGWDPEQGEDSAWYWVVKQDWEKVTAMETIAIKALIDALKKRNSFAVNALVEIGAPAVDPLIAYLIKELDWAAAEALDKLGWEPDGGKAEACYWIAKGNYEKAYELGAPATERLIVALEDDFYLDINICKVLGNIDDPRVVKYLITKLEISDHESVLAAEALGNIANPLAVGPLIDALDDFAELRKKAAEALVKIYKKKGIEEKYKKQILDKRKIITSKHSDYQELDEVSSCLSHEDQGIGVDFPL